MRIRAQDEDITKYIKRKIAENPRANRLIARGNCKDKVVSKLVECANGMFLLAHFQVEYLCKQTTSKEMLGELENLKSYSGEEKPLDPTYDRAMDILRSQPKNCVRLALKVLSWLVKGQRVFTVRELQMAVSVEQDRTTFDEQDFPDKKTLIDVCAGLVTIDDTSNTVRLAHYTAQEYLLSHLILPDDADFELAMACTTFLSFNVFAQGACATYESRRSLYPFLDYAAKNLGFHLKACDETLTTGIVYKFLGKIGSISSYSQAYFAPQGESSFIWDYPKGRASLHIAAFLGHYPVARILLDCTSTTAVGRSPETIGVGGRSGPAAAKKKGADISATDNSGNTTLHLAVEKGVDISATDDLGRTALHLAAERGHEPVVLLLLEKGADISATDKFRKAALHLAAGLGHGPVVLLLLEKGADISATDDFGKTLLHPNMLLPIETNRSPSRKM